MVWKLDRLARSLKQLIETVEGLGEKGMGLRSLTEAIDTTTSGGKLIFHIFVAIRRCQTSISVATGTPTSRATGVQMSTSAASVSMETTSE